MTDHSNVLLDDEMLLFQILPRLPATSLGRCKCVCKQWHTFLATPMFTKMHLHRVNNQNHHKQLLVPTTKPCKYFRTIDCETPEEVGLSVNRSVPFKANYDEMEIIASLNGLVCVGIDSFQSGIGRYSDIILWNPLTGDYKMLSKANSPINDFEIHAMGYGLYYTVSNDDYKLLRVTLFNHVFIYSLKSDSWREIDSTSSRLLNNWNLSCLLNENLYFFVESRILTDVMDVWSYWIIRFDTEAEKFTEIAAPSMEFEAPRRFSLTVLSGFLHLCVSSVGITSPDKLELWKMDGNGEWTRVVSYCHSLFKGVPYNPLHLMKNGNWLVGSRDNGDALEVDLEMKTGKKMCTCTPIDGPMDILWGGKFVETIVSLNRTSKPSNIVLLADDIMLYQILPRLPFKSLGSFKCVCKQWRSLLTTPEFTKMHLHQVNNQNHPKQLLVPNTKPCKYFQTIDCETPEVGLSANRSIPFEANSNEMSILASLNGLVCVGIDSFQPRSGIILWNPLTGEYKTLPMDNFHLNGFTADAIGFGLYYSCCDDDYKLLRVTIYKDAFIYSLKSNSWRKVESTSGRRVLKTKYWNSSCLLNEDLYFLERSINNMKVLSYSIIRFDTKTEKFTEIAAPSLRDVVKWCFSLMVAGGCVYLCASLKVNCWDKFALWKMDGDGGWTKVVSCCRWLSMRGFYQPLHLMKNGNWLVGSKGEGAYEVDLKRKTTKMVCNTDGAMHFLWGGKFVETIVSLNK